MDFMRHWGNWVQNQRKAIGYSVERLSKATGISVNQIYNIEKGQGDSRKSTLQRLLHVLGDDNAYEAVLSYMEPDIHPYLPLIQALDRLPQEERCKELQQIHDILS